ncbi:MAG: TolC family protein [Deltaproteobacteria bacterium]|nr:TolC family protein [Deltaproteobacteria bacterium]
MKSCIFLFLVIGLQSSVFGQTPLTLRDCFDKALEISERVAISEAEIGVMEKKYAQAIGAILPSVHFIASEFLQDDSSTALGAGDVGTTLTRFSTPTVKFNAKQPIFNGLREYFALSVTKAQKRQSRAQYEDAKRNLFLDVAGSFYTVVQLEEDLKILKNMEATLLSRLAESRERVRLGKARASETINTESDLAQQQAAISEVEGALAAAREVLGFFVGDANASLHDDLLFPKEPKEEDYFLKTEIQRPDIIAAEEGLKASKAMLKIEKGYYLPTINAEANYYNYRVGFQEPIKWDALFTLDFSIFEGGRTRAKVQEAKIVSKQSALTLRETRRTAEMEIKKAWQDFTSGLKRTEALRLAGDKGRENYTASEKDYRLGLINNIELLEVLRNFQNVERTLSRTSLQTKLNYLNLEVKAGKPLP